MHRVPDLKRADPIQLGGADLNRVAVLARGQGRRVVYLEDRVAGGVDVRERALTGGVFDVAVGLNQARGKKERPVRGRGSVNLSNEGGCIPCSVKSEPQQGQRQPGPVPPGHEAQPTPRARPHSRRNSRKSPSHQTEPIRHGQGQLALVANRWPAPGSRAKLTKVEPS